MYLRRYTVPDLLESLGFLQAVDDKDAANEVCVSVVHRSEAQLRCTICSEYNPAYERESSSVAVLQYISKKRLGDVSVGSLYLNQALKQLQE